jgi:hypothetical protein
LLFVVIFNDSSEKSIGLIDRIFVGIPFILSCLIGITLAFYPGSIRRIIKNRMKKTTKTNAKKTTRKRIGHHPDCDCFKNHRIRVNGKTYCSGCLGISIGCLISIILMVFYILNYFNLSTGIVFYLVILGFFIIGFVFIEIILNNRYTTFHIITNSLLIIGFLIIVIGIVESTGNKNYGIISIIFSVLWLDTRIQLSQLNHKKICRSCNSSCKMY